MNFDKNIYNICEGDTIAYIPTGQIGIVLRIHISEEIYGDQYELKLFDPDIKLWTGWKEIELLYPV